MSTGTVGGAVCVCVCVNRHMTKQRRKEPRHCGKMRTNPVNGRTLTQLVFNSGSYQKSVLSRLLHHKEKGTAIPTESYFSLIGLQKRKRDL